MPCAEHAHAELLAWLCPRGHQHGCVVSLSFTACSGHHISLRLLSLHLCKEYLSLPKKKKKKKKKDGHCASKALLQTWHRLRLAVLHSIWTAARITASSTQGLAPTQASPSPAHSHLASRLALKTIASMNRHDWVKCSDDVRQISGVCSSWLRGRDPNMTLEAFQHLWCHNNTLASIHTVQTGTEERLELKVHLSASSPVPLF